MRIKQTSLELISLAVLSIIVMMLFRSLDRATASIIASFCFLCFPAGMMFFRWKNPFEIRVANLIWWGGVLIFWLGFALPIFAVRLFHGSENFNEYVLFGYKMSSWHQGSTSAFTAMALCILSAGLLRYKK